MNPIRVILSLSMIVMCGFAQDVRFNRRRPGLFDIQNLQVGAGQWNRQAEPTCRATSD
jgi:hypothetical protein